MPKKKIYIFVIFAYLRGYQVGLNLKNAQYDSTLHLSNALRKINLFSSTKGCTILNIKRKIEPKYFIGNARYISIKKLSDPLSYGNTYRLNWGSLNIESVVAQK